MAEQTLARISGAFGWEGFPDGLFYTCDHALRFELAGDLKTGPTRFARAMERARTISKIALEGSVNLTAVVTHYAGEKRTRREAAAFNKLAKIGFSTPFGRPDRVFQNDGEHIKEFGEDLCRYWYSADFFNTEESITALLWVALAQNLGVAPRIQWMDGIYIVDYTRKIVVWPYDDRGLDVVAEDASFLRRLYEDRNEWLLDHDREAMDAKFR